MLIVTRRWQSLDGWDVVLFGGGLVVGSIAASLGAAALGKPSMPSVVGAGFSVGLAAIGLRRLLSPKALAREDAPPARALSGLGLLVMALGGIAVLISLFAEVLAVAFVSAVTTGDPSLRDVTLSDLAIALAVPLGGFAIGTGLIVFGHRYLRI